MVSKLCSRSQGQPSVARSRAMIPTRRSNLSPVVIGLVGIAGRWNSHCGTGVLVCVHGWIRTRSGLGDGGEVSIFGIGFVLQFCCVECLLGSALPLGLRVSSSTE